jgi:hypothetical protein
MRRRVMQSVTELMFFSPPTSLMMVFTNASLIAAIYTAIPSLILKLSRLPPKATLFAPLYKIRRANTTKIPRGMIPASSFPRLSGPALIDISVIKRVIQNRSF